MQFLQLIFLKEYNANSDNELCASSVAATEHSDIVYRYYRGNTETFKGNL
jgi:hypothetical protein